MGARIAHVVGAAFVALALVGLTPIVQPPAALADPPDRQPGVSVRLNDFDDITPTAPEHAAHPDLELISIMAPWGVLEPSDQQFALGSGSVMDQNIQDARTGGYKIVLRIMAGRLEPSWLLTGTSAQSVELLGTDVNASDYCDHHEVVVPWDPVLKTQYTQLLHAIGQWLAQPDGAGGTKGDHVFVVPVSMPSFQGTEMNWGYGPATAVCPPGTDGAGADLSATNKAAWDAINTEAQRRTLSKQAWKDAIDIHMAELPAGVDSSIAYGALFADGQAGAIDIAQDKVADYPTRLWSLYTNLQPEVLTDGSLGTYRQWCQKCHEVMMEVSGLKGLLGYQTASVNINDTAAKFHAATEDGLATYGMRFLETQPGNVSDYYSYLLTEPNHVQGRIRAVNHQRTTATNVSCDPVTVGHVTNCTASVSDTDTGAKIPPAGARTVTWPGGGAFTPQTCTPDGNGSTRSCTVAFTPPAAGTQPVTATYLGDSNHNGGTGTVQLNVAKRTSQTDVTCADASVAIGVATTCTATVIDTSPAPGGSPPTGDVTWTGDAAGSFSPATCTLTGTGGTSASCHVTYTGSATGNNLAVTGTYGGGARHTGSSDGTTIRITKRSTTTAISCQSPVLVGSASTCTATVTDIDTGTKTTPGGTVTWSGGGAGLSSSTCTLAGTGAQATCTVTYTPSTAGTVTLSASYGGDPSHLEGASSTTVTATLRPTSTSVQCDGSVVVGAPATCTATVTDTGAGTAITPTGTVSWSAGGQGSFSSPTCTLAGSGAAASCSVTYTPSATGTPTVVASYGGDQRHASGTASTQITGTARSTSMTVECETPVLVNSAATCTATVTDTDAGSAITPAGQVSWSKSGAGALSSQTCTLSGSGGVASCSVDYTPSAAATHTVTATYPGGQQHGLSSGSALVTATARQTATSVTCESPAPVGVPTPCTATVTDTDAAPAITPTGTVSWSRDRAGTFSASSCPLAGSGAAATCSVTYTRNLVDAETITAIYGADGAHLGSQGAATVQATKRSTTTTVDCGTPVLVGSTTTCTATVTDTESGSPFTPTGTVTWSTDGNGVLGSGTCTPTGTGAVATCTVTYSRSSAGSETVTASYGGDAKHVGSVGNRAVQAVLRATSTSVACDTPVLVGSSSTCTATVADTSPGPAITPDGPVQWSMEGSGTFSAPTCAPAGGGATATCSVTYTAAVAATHAVTATFTGDSEHEASAGSAQIRADARLTATAAQCDTPVLLGASSTCTATVTDTSPGAAITPGGAVHWFSGGEDENEVFSDDACTVSGTGATATCSVTYTPASGGSHEIGATYGGTGVHATSSDGAQVNVTVPQQTIAFRSSAFAANPVANNLVIPKPANVQAGDVMLASVAVRSNPTVTAPAGWSLVTTTANGSNLRELAYTRVATTSEPTSYRWGFNQNRAASGAILAYSGVSTATPVQAFSGGIGSSSTITAPSATTVTTGAMVVGAFSIANGATVTPPGGMTERGEVASSSKIRTEIADVIQPSAGPTGAKAAVASSSGANVGQLIVLRPGSGGPAPNQDPTFDQDLLNRSDAQGAVISLSAHATDPDDDPLEYSATGLPPGLSINASTGLISGTISGTAAAGSPYAVSVRVSDDHGATIGATDTFTWTVTAGGGGGSVTFRASSFAANATANNLVIPKPAGVVAGDVLIAVFDVKVHPTVTAPSGWTLTSANSNGSELTQRIYTKVAGTAEPASYQWSYDETRAASGGILAYRGVSTTAPIAIVGTVGRATSTAITAPSVTTSFDGAVVLGAFGINNGSSITQPAGMTERGEIASGSKIKTEVAEVVQASAGATGAKTATAASSGVNIGQLIVLRPA